MLEPVFQIKHDDTSLKIILCIGFSGVLCFLETRKVEEVCRPVNLVVKLARICELETVLHRLRVLHAHEIVVPDVGLGNHEEAKEAIGEQHLDLLVMRRGVALRVGARVTVAPTPLSTGCRELVCRQRARARCEAAGNDNRFLAVPLLVVGQDA